MFARLLFGALLAVATASSQAPKPAGAAKPAAKPITKDGLIQALKSGGLSANEIVQYVRQRGVDFVLTPPVEAELKTAGATPELLGAVKASQRPAAQPVASAKPAAKPVPPPPVVPPPPRSVAAKAPAGTPLTKAEIITLLQVGTDAGRLEQLITDRGVNFALTAPVSQELQAAGAAPSTIDAIRRHSRVQEPAQPVSHAPAPPASPAPVERGRPTGRSSTLSLRDVHKLYIEKMPEDLDQYIRAEFSKQMHGRISVVLNVADADAVMGGVAEHKDGVGAAVTGRGLGLHDTATGAVTITDRSKTMVLWSEEAGDRSLLLGGLRRGGPRKVAQRLVSKLKKALE